MRTDVLIIGGGLAGAASAFFLARDGVDIVLLDRFDLNTQASGTNAGSLHIQIPHDPFMHLGEDWAREFATTIPLLMDSIALWAELGETLGADLEVSTRGGLLVAHTKAQMRDISRKAAIERQWGAAIELLDGSGVRELAPYVSEAAVGGAWCPDEGKANPLQATPAFAAAAAGLGARVLRNREVRALTESTHGFTAHTPEGPIEARRVVNCAGADAGRIAAMLGIALPIQGHPIQVSVTEPVAPMVPHLVYAAAEKLTLKQTSNGTFVIGGGWPATRRKTDGSLAVSLRSLRDNLQVALSVVPALGDVHVVRTWPAIVNGTADWKPILGEVPGHPGFFMNMFPWMGFTAGPIAAQTVAALVLGRRPDVDLARFSVLRYA